MRQSLVSVKDMAIAANKKLEDAFINAERKICGGKTIDEKLGSALGSAKVKVIESAKTSRSWFARKPKPKTIEESPEYMRILAEVETEMKMEREEAKLRIAKKAEGPKEPIVVEEPKVNIITPFTPCKDTFNRKPASVKKVQAIRTTIYCPFCKEVIPAEAHFCPHCRGQIVVPVAKLKGAPETACKIKGMPPVNINPAPKRTLGQQIKTALTTDVKVAFKPMAKVKSYY